MAQATILPVGSSPPVDWWRRVTTAVNALIGRVDSLYNRPTLSVTTDYTVTDADYAIFVDASGGSITVTLPSPTKGRQMLVKKINAANTVNLGGTVDGSTSATLTAQWQVVRLIGTGTAWYTL